MENKPGKSLNTLETAAGEIASTEGVAVVIVSDDQMTKVSSSNDNSICEILSDSKEFRESCEKYCGQVYRHALRSAKPLRYKCHAGLECIASAAGGSEGRPLVAITGRTFTKAEDYRLATERAISGDWRGFPPTKFFENVLFSSDARAIEKAAKRIVAILGKPAPVSEAEEPVEPPEAGPVAPSIKKDDARVERRKREASEWRSRFASILKGDYAEAHAAILTYLSERYGIGSSAWLEVKRNSFEKVRAEGELRDQKIQISVAADDKALVRLLEKDASVELKERGVSPETGSQSLRLFPFSSAGTIRSALVIGEKAGDEAVVSSISRFCASLAPELEILRLRSELNRRQGLGEALQKFNLSLRAVDTEEFWMSLIQATAELVQAERGSLMVFDDESQKLNVKAALGAAASEITSSESGLGERISSKVWQTGKPAVVEDISKLSMAEAPAEWRYRSKSFVSYPLIVGDRKIGVINLTDKAGGLKFDDFDLELLESVMPQVALAVDRAVLKSRAGEFEKLSVTDSLTGLLNRRYLEQRLREEVKRSSRHDYPMCFIMIDVDDFKSYNDTFLHPEGDKALKIVGNCLKDTLRGADVAVRYGGEEFSVLLPQTTLEEGQIIAERIRSRVESTRFPHRQVTVSVGIATLSLEINTPEKLIEAADAALFDAKRLGKNSVRVYSGRASGSGHSG